MDSDIPKKMSGFLKEFKAYRAKTKQIVNQSKSSENAEEFLTESIQVITRTGDVVAFDAEKISVAIGKAFLEVEGNLNSISIHDRLTQLTEMVLNTFNRTPNYSFYSYAFYEIQKLETISYQSIDLLEDNIESSISSIFKKLKNITSTIVFITTRSFSIQKNLSISA